MFNSQYPHSHLQMSRGNFGGKVLTLNPGTNMILHDFHLKNGLHTHFWSCYTDFSLWLPGTILPQAVRNTGPTLWVSLDTASPRCFLLSFLYYSESPPSWFIPFHFLFLFFPLCSLTSYSVTNWKNKHFPVLKYHMNGSHLHHKFSFSRNFSLWNIIIMPFFGSWEVINLYFKLRLLLLCFPEGGK